MVMKAFAFLTTKADLSRADYIDYYEKHHVALTTKLMTGALDYRRNHIVTDGSFGEAPEFSTITEFWFRDRAAFDATLAIQNDPETARILSEDEANVFDSSKTRMFLVEEMGPHQSKDVADIDIGERLRDYYACYNRGDVEELARFYAEDVELVAPHMTVEGREAMVATYSRLQSDFVDLMSIERMMVSGPVLLVESRNLLTARHKVAEFFGETVEAGAQLKLDISAVYEWQDGKIKKITIHFI